MHQVTQVGVTVIQFSTTPVHFYLTPSVQVLVPELLILDFYCYNDIFHFNPSPLQSLL